MRSVVLVAVFGAVAVLLQTTLLHGTRIDLVLVLCVYLALDHQSVGGATGSFLLGYVLDTFSGTDVGINAFAMTFVFLCVYLLSRRLWIEGGVSQAVLVLAASLVKTLSVACLVVVFSGTFGAANLAEDALGAVLAALSSPLVFRALRQAGHRLGVGQGA